MRWGGASQVLGNDGMSRVQRRSPGLTGVVLTFKRMVLTTSPLPHILSMMPMPLASEPWFWELISLDLFGACWIHLDLTALENVVLPDLSPCTMPEFIRESQSAGSRYCDVCAHARPRRQVAKGLQFLR